MTVVAASSVYETEPMYREDQGLFLNCVIVVETSLLPEDLLEFLKTEERGLGRERRRARNAPRVIDMDIIFYGDTVVSNPSLQVPHPKAAERAFVLVPLDEVRPLLLHPVLKKTAAELLGDLGSRKRVVKVPGVLAGFSPSSPRRPARPEGSASRRGS